MKDSRDEFRIDQVRVVRRGKKGIFQAEFHSDGQHRRVSLKTSNLEIAKQKARKLNAKLAMGTFEAPIERITVTVAIERYLTHVMSVGRAKSTVDCYRRVLTKFETWCQRSTLLKLQDLTVAKFEDYLLVLRGKTSRRTVHNHAVIIKQFVKWSATRGLINSHLLRLCSLSKPPRNPRYVPDLAGVWKLLDATPPAVRTPMALLAMTGMRRGELQRLRVEDIDLKRGWIYIVSRPGLETKTGRSWKVPIHPVLLEMLKEYRLPRNGFAFVTPSTKSPLGTRWLDVNAFGRQARLSAKQAGLKAGRVEEGLTLHTFRRFMETHAVNSGVPQRCVDAWLGHNSDQSMGAVYYTLTDEQSHTFMRSLPLSRPAATA